MIRYEKLTVNFYAPGGPVREVFENVRNLATTENWLRFTHGSEGTEVVSAFQLGDVKSYHGVREPTSPPQE